MGGCNRILLYVRQRGEAEAAASEGALDKIFTKAKILQRRKDVSQHHFLKKGQQH